MAYPIQFNNLYNLLIIYKWSNFKLSNWIVYAVIAILSFNTLIVYADNLKLVEFQNVDNGIYYPIQQFEI